MIIKNVSGETRYFGFQGGARGRTMANNATSTLPDGNPVVDAQVRAYVAAGVLQITEGPATQQLTASVTTPAFGYVQANGAISNTATVSVGGITYEFTADPGSAVLGSYHSGLSNAAYKWAGAGAAAATAAGTLRTAINANSATTGVVADAAILWDTGKYVLPLRRADGSAAIGSIALAVSGSNLVVSGAALLAGVTGASRKQVTKVYTVVAGDVTNGMILLPTGLASLVTVQARVRTSAGVEKAWDGAILTSGGNIVLNNAGTIDYAAGDVFTIEATGN